MKSLNNSQHYADTLYTLADQVLELCKQNGAQQADVSLAQDTGFSANVRLGEVETVERTNDQGVPAGWVHGAQAMATSTGVVRPNPSLKRSANGRPPGPVWRYAVHFRQPGPGVLPSSPA